MGSVIALCNVCSLPAPLGRLCGDDGFARNNVSLYHHGRTELVYLGAKVESVRVHNCCGI